MTGRWRDLDEPERESARAVFAALDNARLLSDSQVDALADALADAEVPASPSMSAIWSAMVSGNPLPVGVRSGPELDALLARASVAAIPRLAAAATGAQAVDRRAQGVRVRVVPSRAEAKQSYLIIAFDDPGAEVARLVVTADLGEPVELSLPPPVGGTVQVLLDDDAPVLLALADPDARIYLI